MTLVMNGVNGEARGIPGALKFQARVRVLPRRRQDSAFQAEDGDPIFASPTPIPSRSLIAAATSYKNYHDVSGNPEAIVKNQIAAADQKWANATFAMV